MEKATLIVKNFGPLKDIKIEVRPTIAFIGTQATGKSTLAKLIAIFEDDKFRNEEKITFENELKKYNIQNFLKENTEIYYTSSNEFSFKFKFEKGKYEKDSFNNRFLNKTELFSKEALKKNISTHEEVFDFLVNYYKLDKEKKEKFKLFFYKIVENTNIEKLEEKLIKGEAFSSIIFNHIGNIIGEKIHTNSESIYLSTERTILHLIASNVFTLLNQNINIPKHILLLGQEYEKACNSIQQVNLNIIDKGIVLKRENNKSYIYTNDSRLEISESASGIQSLVPILHIIEYYKSKEEFNNLSYIIEEPELNIYPKAQHELIKYLIKNCTGNDRNLIITTHSPFVLASLNNCLFAFEKGQIQPKEVNKLIKKESWLDPKTFIAYQLKNGKATLIMDDKLGQIKENMIDEVSDQFSIEFDNLLAL